MSSQLRDPEALRLVEQAITRDPRYGPALAWGALCCFRLFESGRSEDREVDRGTITPVVVPTYLVYRNPEHRELFLSGLRLAAGET